MGSGSVELSVDMSVWPPAGAVAVDMADGYERLAERGYGYGPVFRGLTAMWRRGDELFADVKLPVDTEVSVAGFGIHPALLDAALHAMLIANPTAELVLPFSWQSFSLHATGASAVRVRIAPTSLTGTSSVSIELVDGLGLPVLSLTSMVAQQITGQQLLAAVSNSVPERLFEVVWSAQPETTPTPISVRPW